MRSRAPCRNGDEYGILARNSWLWQRSPESPSCPTRPAIIHATRSRPPIRRAGDTRDLADPTDDAGSSPVAALNSTAPTGYELLEMIGHGGMGIVLRARDTRLSRDVAVKVLQEKYSPTSLAARRFIDEARITGQLQHPGIPPVHDVGTLPDGRPFLAMKLIKGRTLADMLADGPIAPTAGRCWRHSSRSARRWPTPTPTA